MMLFVHGLARTTCSLIPRLRRHIANPLNAIIFKYDFTFAHAITLGYGTFADT
jgi:hypothetical protein